MLCGRVPRLLWRRSFGTGPLWWWPALACRFRLRGRRRRGSRRDACCIAHGWVVCRGWLRRRRGCWWRRWLRGGRGGGRPRRQVGLRLRLPGNHNCSWNHSRAYQRQPDPNPRARARRRGCRGYILKLLPLRDKRILAPHTPGLSRTRTGCDGPNWLRRSVRVRSCHQSLGRLFCSNRLGLITFPRPIPRTGCQIDFLLA